MSNIDIGVSNLKQWVSNLCTSAIATFFYLSCIVHQENIEKRPKYYSCGYKQVANHVHTWSGTLFIQLQGQKRVWLPLTFGFMFPFSRLVSRRFSLMTGSAQHRKSHVIQSTNRLPDWLINSWAFSWICNDFRIHYLLPMSSQKPKGGELWTVAKLD
jgi:hypothetical protein